MNRKQRRAAARAGAKGTVSATLAPAIADDFRQAQALHQSGRLGEAEALYRRMLEADPGNALALHFLGVIAYQGGNLATAEDLMTLAVQRQPDYAEAHNNLGSAFKAQDKLADAKTCYRRAIALKPGLADAH
ncbi:MAG: tetratricopeptide repeat protein, partial [Alphaproteobacteria bacterium]